MPVRVGPLPLATIDAVAIDLETTGLDPRRDRIVQIGAVPLRRGVPDESAGLSLLVDPGVSIPPTATAVHGITDDDVRGAAAPDRALAELMRFIDGRPLIGHAIGFDLAVLASEARRQH